KTHPEMVTLLVFRNAFRQPLRAGLTSFGIAVALFAFCFINALIRAWYAGVDSSNKDRLIVRSSVSLSFFLPYSYYEVVKRIPGVERACFALWFGGVYKDERNRFAQFAIGGDDYFDVHTELVIPPDQRKAYLADRRGAIIGKKLAEDYGLRIGDVVQLQ